MRIKMSMPGSTTSSQSSGRTIAPRPGIFGRRCGGTLVDDAGSPGWKEDEEAELVAPKALAELSKGTEFDDEVVAGG